MATAVTRPAVVATHKRVLREVDRAVARAAKGHLATASEERFSHARAQMSTDKLVRTLVTNGVQVCTLVDWMLAVRHPDCKEASDVLETVWLSHGADADETLHVWIARHAIVGPAKIYHTLPHGELIVQLDRLRRPLPPLPISLGETADDIREDGAILHEFVDLDGLEEAERQLKARIEEGLTRAQRSRAEYLLLFCTRVREQYATTRKLKICDGSVIRVLCMRSRYERRHDTDGRIYSLGNGVIEKNEHGKDQPRSIDTTGMPRVLRPFFLQRFAHDYDQANSQAVILLQMAETMAPEVDVTELRRYINDRKSLFDHVAETYGFERLNDEDRKELVKPLVLRLMFAGTLLGWQLEHGLDPRQAPPCPRIRTLEAELSNLRAAIFAHPDWSEWVERDRQRLRDAQLRRPADKRKNDEQIERSVFARIAQSQENVVLTAMRTYLAENKFKTLALVFDGLIVLHNFKRAPDLDAMSAYIKDYCGFDMRIEEKPMFAGPGARWPKLAL